MKNAKRKEILEKAVSRPYLGLTFLIRTACRRRDICHGHAITEDVEVLRIHVVVTTHVGTSTTANAGLKGHF
jgi:hypothetical protein